MNTFIAFLFGAFFAIIILLYMLYSNRVQIIDSYKKSIVTEYVQGQLQYEREGFKMVVLSQQNIINQQIEFKKLGQSSPSPTLREGGENEYMSARTHAHTHQLLESTEIFAKYRGSKKYLSSDFAHGDNYISYYQNGMKYIANFPQSTEQSYFFNNEDEKIEGLFIKWCENSSCKNIVISDSYQTKTCSDKCHNQKRHN